MREFIVEFVSFFVFLLYLCFVYFFIVYIVVCILLIVGKFVDVFCMIVSLEININSELVIDFKDCFRDK